MFGSKVGKNGTKWTNLGLFQMRFQYILGRTEISSEKVPDLSYFGANLIDFWAKSEMLAKIA